MLLIEFMLTVYTSISPLEIPVLQGSPTKISTNHIYNNLGGNIITTETTVRLLCSHNPQLNIATRNVSQQNHSRPIAINVYARTYTSYDSVHKL